MNDLKQLEAATLRSLYKVNVAKSQAAFGRDNGLGSAAMVHQYLSAKRPLSLITGIRFSVGMGVALSSFSPRLAAELELGLQAMPKSRDGSDALSDYARVRCVKILPEINKPSYKTVPLSEVGAFIAFRHNWLAQRKYKSQYLLAILMNDEGMRQTLDVGDLIVVNTESLVPIDSGVFAVNYEGELRVRRLVRDAGHWWLYCDNPDTQRYPRKRFVEKRCYLIGQIVNRQSDKI